ncbi:MAG: hypothetical protein ABSE93_01425 [Terriglobia bacterium]
MITRAVILGAGKGRPFDLGSIMNYDAVCAGPQSTAASGQGHSMSSGQLLLARQDSARWPGSFAASSAYRALSCDRGGLPVLLLAIALCPFAAAKGAETQPEIQILPSSVELPSNPKQATHLLVVLRNVTDAELREVRLSWLPEGGVKISPLTFSEQAVAAHAEVGWAFEFSQSRLDPVTGTVNLRVDYKLGSVPKVLTQSLAVKSHEAEAIDKFLDAKIETTLETLDTYHKGKIDLLLTNKLGQDVNVDIKADAPDFICFDPAQNGCKSGMLGEGASWLRSVAEKLRKLYGSGQEGGGVRSSSEAIRSGVSLKGYQSTQVPFEVGAKERVEPGKYLVTFEITLKANDGQSADRSLVKTQVVEVGVLAESTILKLLGVPSFLLLPGCLLMLTVGLLGDYGPSWFRPREKANLPEPNSTYFWLVSITVSGLMAAGFRAVFGWWYFVRYGLVDLVLVWLASVVLGAVLYAGLFLVGQELPRWLVRKRTPTKDDDAATVLRRLWWQRVGLTLERYTIKGDKSGEPVFLIKREDEKSAWVSPAISLSLPKNEKLAQEIQEATREGRLRKLANLVSKEEDIATLKTQPIEGPRLYQLAELEPTTPDRDEIVEIT